MSLLETNSTQGEVPSAVNPENEYISGLYKYFLSLQWDAYSRTGQNAKSLFKALLECPSPFMREPPPSWKLGGIQSCYLGEEPTTELGFIDMWYSSKAFLVASSGKMQEMPSTDALISLMGNFGTSSDSPFTPPPSLYPCQIVCTAEGLGSCKFVYALEEPDDFFIGTNYQNGRAFQWSTAMIPCCGLTTWHVDETTRDQYMIHFHGRKIWMTAPWTQHNAMVYATIEGETNVKTSLRAISRFKGTMVWLCEAPCSFRLPAGTIHMVFTLDYAMHVGIAYVSVDGFEHCRSTTDVTLKALEEWERINLKHLRDQKERAFLLGGMDCVDLSYRKKDGVKFKIPREELDGEGAWMVNLWTGLDNWERLLQERRLTGREDKEWRSTNRQIEGWTKILRAKLTRLEKMCEWTLKNHQIVERRKCLDMS